MKTGIGGTAMNESMNSNAMEATELTREKTIVKTSIIGIVANVFLAAFNSHLFIAEVLVFIF